MSTGRRAFRAAKLVIATHNELLAARFKHPVLRLRARGAGLERHVPSPPTTHLCFWVKSLISVIYLLFGPAGQVCVSLFRLPVSSIFLAITLVCSDIYLHVFAHIHNL